MAMASRRKTGHRVVLGVLLGAALPACDSGPATGKTPPAGAPGAKSGVPSTAPAATGANLPDHLLGRWMRAEGDTGFFWHLAGDGQFQASFDKPAKPDLSLFPEPMRNKAPNWFGEWHVTDTELVLNDVSAQGQALIREVRVPLKWEKGRETIDIDGAVFRREKP